MGGPYHGGGGWPNGIWFSGVLVKNFRQEIVSRWRKAELFIQGLGAHVLICHFKVGAGQSEFAGLIDDCIEKESAIATARFFFQEQLIDEPIFAPVIDAKAEGEDVVADIRAVLLDDAGKNIVWTLHQLINGGAMQLGLESEPIERVIGAHQLLHQGPVLGCDGPEGEGLFILIVMLCHEMNFRGFGPKENPESARPSGFSEVSGSWIYATNASSSKIIKSSEPSSRRSR